MLNRIGDSNEPCFNPRFSSITVAESFPLICNTPGRENRSGAAILIPWDSRYGQRGVGCGDLSTDMPDETAVQRIRKTYLLQQCSQHAATDAGL